MCCTYFLCSKSLKKYVGNIHFVQYVTIIFVKQVCLLVTKVFAICSLCTCIIFVQKPVWSVPEAILPWGLPSYSQGWCLHCTWWHACCWVQGGWDRPVSVLHCSSRHSHPLWGRSNQTWGNVASMNASQHFPFLCNGFNIVHVTEIVATILNLWRCMTVFYSLH